MYLACPAKFGKTQWKRNICNIQTGWYMLSAWNIYVLLGKDFSIRGRGLGMRYIPRLHLVHVICLAESSMVWYKFWIPFEITTKTGVCCDKSRNPKLMISLYVRVCVCRTQYFCSNIVAFQQRATHKRFGRTQPLFHCMCLQNLQGSYTLNVLYFICGKTPTPGYYPLFLVSKTCLINSTASY